LQAKNVGKHPVLGNREIKCSWAKFDLADPANFEDPKPGQVKNQPNEDAKEGTPEKQKGETKEELAAKLKAAEEYQRKMQEKLELQKRQREIAEAKAEAKAALISKMRAAQDKKRKDGDGGKDSVPVSPRAVQQDHAGQDDADHQGAPNAAGMTREQPPTPPSPRAAATSETKPSLEEERLALLKKIAAAEERKKKRAQGNA